MVEKYGVNRAHGFGERGFFTRWVGLVLLCLALPACGSEGPLDPIDTPGDLTRTLESGGRERVYELHVPGSVNLSAPSPLVILLHGVPRGGGMRPITGFDAVADVHGFVVAYPRNHGIDWNVGCGDLCTSAERNGVDDVAFLREMIDDIARDLSIDRDRVYMAGFSQGALMTYHAVCELSGRIAAFASVGGSMLDVVADGCGPSALPALFIQGTEDPQFPWDGKITALSTALPMRETIAKWVGINGCSSQPAVAELPDEHDDGTSVTLEEYRSCSAGAEIDFYIIAGGGHTWPGAPVQFSPGLGRKSLEVDASELLGDFFARN